VLLPNNPDFLSLLWDSDPQQLLLVACPDGIIVTGADGRVLLYTGASEALFGFSPVEVLSRPAEAMFASPEEFAAFRRRLESDGHLVNVDLLGRRRDGVVFPAAVSASVLHDRYGDSIGQVMYIRDHTHLRVVQNDLRDKNVRLNQMVATLDRAARHDHLTGLLNRGSALEAAEHALLDCGLNGRPFGVAVFDLDRFKSVNDSHGHLAGDEVLSALSQVLHGTARAADIVGRFGGEEFVAFIPNADLEAVAAFADRVRTKIEAASVTIRGELVVRVTVSAGVASIPGCAGNLNEAIRIADERLLAAKRAGRNRVSTQDDISDRKVA
jgi:diguanylate cyclase (GGDEF)-like protein/PAS domain S-box-containing protein